MFVKSCVLMFIDVSKFPMHTLDKNNNFEDVNVEQIVFEKPYKHTAILSRKAQFF